MIWGPPRSPTVLEPASPWEKYCYTTGPGILRQYEFPPKFGCASSRNGNQIVTFNVAEEIKGTLNRLIFNEFHLIFILLTNAYTINSLSWILRLFASPPNLNSQEWSTSLLIAYFMVTSQFSEMVDPVSGPCLNETYVVFSCHGKSMAY